MTGLACAVAEGCHKYNMCPYHAMQTSSLSPDSATLIPCSASPLPLRRPRSLTHHADDMGSDDSSSDGSRSASPSPSPTSRRRFPSLAFADAIDIPFKSPISQPSTTLSSPNLSLSPLTPPSSFGSPGFASCAYPDWPQRDILFPNDSSYCGSQGNSYISDDDLLDLAELELVGGMRVPRTEISWEQTRQPPLVLHALPAVARKAQPTPKKRRRSSPLKRKKMVLGMSPIAEAPE